MYNTSVLCTYNTDEVFLETDEITEEERYFVREAIYRQEILDILGMDDYNEQEMLRAIHELYEKIYECTPLKECMLKLSEHFMSNDAEFGLMMLFAYDYMYLTHICVSEYLEKYKITPQNIEKLNSLLLFTNYN